MDDQSDLSLLFRRETPANIQVEVDYCLEHKINFDGYIILRANENIRTFYEVKIHFWNSNINLSKLILTGEYFFESSYVNKLKLFKGKFSKNFEFVGNPNG